MQRKTIIMVLLLSGLIAGVAGCYYDKQQVLYPANFTCNGAPSYTQAVAPLIQSSCGQSASCHATGSTSGPGPLVTHGELQQAANQVLSSVQAGRMPLGASLTAAQIQTIYCWVNNGTPNN